MFMERKRPAAPTSVQDSNIWAEDVDVIESVAQS